MTQSTLSYSAKFRPSLTSEQIAYLISILQHSPSCAERDAILYNLHKFHLKATHGIVSPSHVSSPRMSLVDSLGFSDSANDSLDHMDNLLSIYESTPNILSKAQLTRVNHHRYINDMMTPEEEAQYESSSHGI